MKIYRVRVCQTSYWDVEVAAHNYEEAFLEAEDSVGNESKNAEFLYRRTDTELRSVTAAGDEKLIQGGR